MENLTPAVREMILKLVNDAMEKQDRYVTINFYEAGPMITIYPLADDENDEN